MSPKKRIYQIDFLRFIAAIGILFAHYLWRGNKGGDLLNSVPLTNLNFDDLGADWVKYCAVCVDLFFIISGFVITLSVRNKSLSYFFRSRVVRLFSVYWLCAIITALITIFFGAPRFSVTIIQFLVNLTMLQDFIDIPRLDGAYWTMSVELRFYALAMAYLFLYRYKKVTFINVAYGWLALTLIYPFISSHFLVKILDLFLMFEWSAAFIAGIIMAEVYKVQKLTLKTSTGLILTFCLCSYNRVIYANKAAVFYNESISGTFIVLGMFIVFALMLMVIFGRFQWLNKPYFLVLGIMTYPLYLLHQRIGYIIFNNLMYDYNKYVILTGTTVLMIFVSFIIVKYIAGPIADFIDGLLGITLKKYDNIRKNDIEVKKIK